MAVRTVAPRDARELIAKGDVDIVDVREPHEWATGHIPGARLVPLGRLRSDPEAAKLGARVLFVCERGGRSLRAGEVAEKQGIGEVYNVDGGILAWTAAGLPLEKPEKLPVEEDASELDAVVGA